MGLALWNWGAETKKSGHFFSEKQGNLLKLRGFSIIDLPCIDICYNALPIQYLWFFKACGYTSGAPGSCKKACSSGLIELNILVFVSVFRAIWGIFDQGPCREIRWKSFISPASPIAEQNGDCHKCLNGRMLQPDSQTNPEGRGKTPKFEHFFIDIRRGTGYIKK